MTAQTLTPFAAKLEQAPAGAMCKLHGLTAWKRRAHGWINTETGAFRSSQQLADTAHALGLEDGTADE